jgi:hypothetical protein
LAPAPDLTLVEDVLQFIGVFVSLSVATVAYKGYRQTESSALLRLATAFTFLGLGFLVEGLVGIAAATALLTTAFLAGLLLQTTGYFFLAFSHAIDVALAKRAGISLLIFPVIGLSGLQLSAVLSILSFYFVMYGFVETLYSYAKTKRPDTLLIAGGLGLIAAGTFVQWLSALYLQVDILSQVLLLVQLLMKEIGLMMLFVPVLGFTLGARKQDGPV